MFRLAIHWQILIGMIAGAVIGIALNLFGSGHTTTVTSGLSNKLPGGITAADVIDSSGRVEINLTRDDGTKQTLVVDPSKSGDNVYRSLDQLKTANPVAAALYEQHGGSYATAFGYWFRKLGNLFLRMLQMVAVPLIIFSLTSGIMGLSGHGGVGRMFSRTLTYYLATSMLAIFTGLLAVNVIRPGLGNGAPAAVKPNDAPDKFAAGELRLSDILMEQIEALIPANPLAALVAPNFLSIIAFTILFAVFALRVGGGVAERIKLAAETGLSVMMALTTAIISLAPVGVFFLMAYVTATQGIGVFQSLFWYVVAVSVALFIHAFITLPLVVKFIAKRSPIEFARAMSPALLTAFSSASSNGTLPLTMTAIETRAGVSNRTGSFVLPLGSTINMDGTALYEVVAVMFIAQLHTGTNLPLSQQLVVAFTALLASVGAAGIPHAGLVMMVIVLQAVGLPVEMQGVILAVDRVLDMARTSVNVWSDCCGCAVIDSMEQVTSSSQTGGAGDTIDSSTQPISAS